MSSNRFVVSRLSVVASFLALCFPAAHSQTQPAAFATPRVLAPVNESQLAVLPGNTLPAQQLRMDRGPLPDGTPTGHMLMMLKRSDAQQKALDQLLLAQKDPKSPQYRKWLTPEEFGAQFGVADADVQAVTSYLASQGFAVGRVFHNKMAVEFSGTVGQVRTAFHTQIHTYTAGAGSFHANASEPHIPAALAPVVKGVTLNNYKAATATPQRMVLDRKTGLSRPLYTDPTAGGLMEAVTPGDLAAIYNIPSTATGSGVTVGVISDSNINLAIPANYRTLFGLPANAPTVVVDGVDPGVNLDAPLAYSAIELLAATAPQANVNFYVAADTDQDSGLDFAIYRALTDNSIQVLLVSAEGCEATLGPATNYFLGQAWEQAAAQGISVIVGAGTGGAAECDAAPNGTMPAAAASQGLAVSGYASTPWDTAVGASDFYYGPTGTVTENNPGPFFNYWSQTNGGAAGFTSAKGYVPEQPFNSSYQANNQQTYTSYVQATGGGVSTVGQTTGDLVTQSPYLRPTYQINAAATNVPGTARVIPDVSLFGGNYNNYSTYLLCIDPADCVNGAPDSVQYSSGADSQLAASAFAGIAALIVQAHGVQGNLNDGLYATYAASPSAFHDITAGTNKVACVPGSPNCVGGYTSTGTGDAYDAAAGFDAASGLGSVNVANLLSGWTSGTGSTVPTVTVSVTKNGVPITTFEHNDPAVQITVTVTGGAGTPSGDVAFTRTAPATQGLFAVTLDTTGQGSFPYPNVAGLLPGGTYSLLARYAGDGTYSAAIGSAPVSVTPVASEFYVLTTGPSGNPVPVYNGQTLPYGTNVHFTFFIKNATTNTDPYSATGYITLTDNGAQVAVLPIDQDGYASFSSSQLRGGSHAFGATYSGDATFNASSLTGPAPSLSIGGVPTNTSLTATDTDPTSTNNTIALVATVTPVQTCSPLAPCPTGAAPGGKVRFKNGNKNLGTVALNVGANTGSSPASSAVLTLIRNTLAAGSDNSVTATYIPDATGNYITSSSASVLVAVGTSAGLINTSTSLSTTPAGANTFTDTSSVVFVATVGAAAGRNLPTGTVTFFSNGTAFAPPVTLTAGIAPFQIPANAYGLLNLPLGQSSILAQYSGDSTHAPSSAAYPINVYHQTATPDFGMQSNVTYQTIAPGNRAAKYTLQFTSMNSLSALGIPISLTYAPPAGITCSGAPTAPNFRKTNYAEVTVTCKPATGIVIGRLSAPGGTAPRGLWMAEGGAALACVLLVGLPGRRRRWQAMLGSMALFVIAAGFTGCGATVANGPQQQYYDTLNGGSGVTPDASGVLAPGTYTVIVTGTANVYASGQANTTVSVIHNLPLKVVVQ